MSVESERVGALALPRERASHAWLLRDIIVPLLLTRFLLTVIGFVAINTMESNPSNNGLGAIPVRHAWVDTWARWDAVWYVRIAREGYSFASDGQSSVAFFPLYPMMMRFGSLVLGSGDMGYALSGIVASNLCLVAGLAWLWKLIALDFDEDVARRAVMYALVAPTTVFLSAVYPMSLMLALSTGAFYYARLSRWGLAIFLASLASLTRPDGILLAGGLAFEYFAQRSFQWRRLFPSVLKIVLLPVGVLAVWMGYLWRNSGDPLAFIHAQRGWKSFSLALYHTDWDIVWGTLVIGACGVLLAIGWVRLRKSYMIWATAMWLLMLSAGRPVSLPRFCLVLFPVYIVLAMYGSRHRFDRLWTALSSMIAVITMLRFGLRYFVG